MKEIALTQGYVALVDDEDYGWVSQWKWCALVKPHTVYATRRSARRGGKQTSIYMHRVLLGAAPGMQTDHINGDGLDNRRENIRQCSAQENQRNSRSHVGSSIYKGVHWHKLGRKWQAYIKVDGRQRHLGYFSVEAVAAAAYKLAAALHFGTFAAGARGDR